MLQIMMRTVVKLWGIVFCICLIAISIGQTRDYPVITFRAEINNQTDIFLLDPRVGDVVNLTQTTAPEWAFNWSQTGNLSYTASYDSTQAGDELFIMTRLGFAREVQTPNVLSTFGGVWSPDGSMYAYYSSYPRNVSDLYLLTIADESSINLTETPTVSETDPLWSPDGRDLLYLLDGNLLLWDVETGNSRILADLAGTDIENPVWSPDGSRVIFYGRQFGNGQNQLIPYLVERTGGTPQRLVFSEVINSPVTWSPDSDAVAFIGNHTDLIIYNVSTHQLQTIAGEMRRYVPAWSQDGRWIAFIQNRQLYAYDRERNEIRILFADGHIKPPLHWRE